MSLHLFFRPVNDLFKTIDVSEHCVVTDGFGYLAALLIENRLDFYIFGQRIPADQLTFLDFGNNKFLVLSAADRKLDLSSVAENEGCHLSIVLPVGERDQIVLSELR